MSDDPDPTEPDFSKYAASLAAELESTLVEKPINLDIDNDDLAVDQPPPPSNTALVLDDWSLRRGKEWAKSKEVKKVFKPSGDGTPAQQKRETEFAAADFLATAWECKPQLADVCVDSRRHHFLASLMETPAYQSLHRSTRHDDVASELAATHFTQQYVAMIQEVEPEDQLDKDAQALQHAQQACDQASSEVNELNEARDSIGCGTNGGDGSRMSAKEVKDLMRRIRSNHQLRMIMETAGRYRRLAQSLQRTKVVHGSDETIGIEYGNDLAKVLPSELVALCDDDLELEFLRKFSDGSLMIRETRSTESEARGPLVIIVDESGSMEGYPIAHAKAMALAIVWIAQHQKRWACLVGFAHDDCGNYHIIPPGPRDTPALMDWLEHFYNGGTTHKTPLIDLPEKWSALGCPEGRTDIITITDACLPVPSKVAKKYNAWREEHQVRTNTIVIGSHPGEFEHVSDRWWSINSLNLDSQGVSECLSV